MIEEDNGTLVFLNNLRRLIILDNAAQCLSEPIKSVKKQLTEKLSSTTFQGYQMGKTIIDYHKKFEHVQSMWLLINDDSQW